MTKKETVALFALVSSLFPRDEKFAKPDKMMIMAWEEMLEDIPFDVVKAAVKANVATSKFPPSISDIRDFATRMTGERRLSADEAWGLATEAMKSYSLRTVRIKEDEPEEFTKFGEPVKIRPSNLEYEAKSHLPHEIWGVLERMGYADVCVSENPDVVRGQFMRIWNAHDKDEYEKRVITGVLPEFLKDMNLLGGGVNGELEEHK